MLRCLPRPMSNSPLRGFTLLELLLALSLTVVVLVLVNMAVDFHLRSLDTRRTQLEEAQLARSILRMIADDLRGGVQHYEQDMSGIESLLQQSVASAAAGSLGEAGAAALGTAAAGGASSSAGGQTGSSSTPSSGFTVQTPNTNAGQTVSSNTSRNSASPSSSSSPQTSFSTNMTSSAGSASASTPSESTSQNTEDLSTTTIPPVPGLFGNQYQLQVDISRLPRIEDYQRYLTADAATAVADVPSDVKTVTYFVQSMPVTANSEAGQPLQDLADPNANGTGLVRRVLDRSVTLWAMNNGNYSGLQNSGELIAPEVAAIEFQYFDGSQFLTQWDSEAEKKLPIAVLVILALRPPGSVPTTAVPPSSLTPETAGNLHLYRMLVYLPAGGQSAPQESSSVPSSSSSDSTAADTGGAATGVSP